LALPGRMGRSFRLGLQVRNLKFVAICNSQEASVPGCHAMDRIAAGNMPFAPTACSNLETYLNANMVGQELAISQIAQGICDHLTTPHEFSPTPLILSLHGPPGVGKSLFHKLAARALYDKDPWSADLKCPGTDCPGYKVLYGMDYTASERHIQSELIMKSLLEHVSVHKESFIVIEEYDKLDCHMRGFFRQLLDGGYVGNGVTLGQSIVVLESHLGYHSLYNVSKAYQTRDPSRLQPEELQRMLKDIVFEKWSQQNCEEDSDTLKMVGLIRFFVPFFPLKKYHLEKLLEMKLRQRANDLVTLGAGELTWDSSVVGFLIDRIDFEGEYAIEGGKEVATVLSRYIAGPVREWKKETLLLRQDPQGQHSEPPRARLIVSRSKQRLEIKQSQRGGGKFSLRKQEL
jgi:ATP-dependent Clp protease ATP-binding subunit ClpA